MASTTINPTHCPRINSRHQHQHGAVVEEIDGLIRVYRDGHVERPPIVPIVTSTVAPELAVTSRDIVIDKLTSIWARFYVPQRHGQLPLLLYFHGGGFCIGSAAWSCYHSFLAQLAACAGCAIMSVNYRLAPENLLPAAYEDALEALKWVRREALCGSEERQWWSKKCNFSSIFLAGDSAGANIAHNVATRLGSSKTWALRPLNIKGTILIQPFFGGEARTYSEQYEQPPHSGLSLATADTYWRLALPPGASRDHPWCNPVADGSVKLEELRLFPTMVCISERDIMKDRELEFCAAMAAAGKAVQHVVYEGVGHAFQVLNKSRLSETRTQEMISHIKSFISQ
ncbi:probable carboxylesterase 17 [Malania oleifera]|uniref:probable carboxylesterase 17 n=1 Tax=Malania oleifera TaxID=397392 RepID=UPI0025AEC774|nr:probable carboxylesterase 17 [Malania oleifera]